MGDPVARHGRDVRRFTLLDAIVLIAAFGVGIAGARYVWLMEHARIMPPPDLKRGWES